MNYTGVVCAYKSQTTTNKCKIIISEVIFTFAAPVSILKVVKQVFNHEGSYLCLSLPPPGNALQKHKIIEKTKRIGDEITEQGMSTSQQMQVCYLT